MTDPREQKKQERPSAVDLRTKLRQRSVVEKIQSVDWQQSSDGPMVVELDPTTACNLACPDCISRDLLNQGFFSRERIRALVTEMVDAGVRAVVLIGGGEPLAHPEIGWVIDHLGSHGVKIGLTTNGVLMHRYVDVVARYASWVRVSMDAATPDTFNRIRPSHSGRSQFGKVVDNMRALVARKTGKLGYSFMIYQEGEFDAPARDGASVEEREAAELARAMVQDDDDAMPFSNVSEIYAGAQLAKEIGCDYFEVKPMYDINHFSIVQKEQLMAVARDQIERALTLQDDGFRLLQATKLHHILDQDGNLEPKSYHRCAVAQLRTLVTPSGVYICPYFRGRADKQIGDVRKTSFGEMWRGAKRRAVLDQLDPAQDCRMHCIRHESNLTLERMIAEPDQIETIEDFDLFI